MQNWTNFNASSHTAQSNVEIKTLKVSSFVVCSMLAILPVSWIRSNSLQIVGYRTHHVPFVKHNQNKLDKFCHFLSNTSCMRKLILVAANYHFLKWSPHVAIMWKVKCGVVTFYSCAQDLCERWMDGSGGGNVHAGVVGNLYGNLQTGVASNLHSNLHTGVVSNLHAGVDSNLHAGVVGNVHAEVIGWFRRWKCTHRSVRQSIRQSTRRSGRQSSRRSGQQSIYGNLHTGVVGNLYGNLHTVVVGNL